MKIQSINLKNYRCFESLHLDFHEQLTVLAGKNCSGKTSILEAIALLAGKFMQHFDGINVNQLQEADVRCKCFKMGNGIDVQKQYPCEIAGDMLLDGQASRWTVKLQSTSPEKTYMDSASEAIYRKYQDRLSKGDSSLILPVFAYYWAGRLWRRQQDIEATDIFQQEKNTRINGYQQCMGSEVNRKTMLQWFSKLIMKKVQMSQDKPFPELQIFMHAVGVCIHKLIGIKKEIQLTMDFDIMDMAVQYYNDEQTIVHLPLGQLSDGLRGTICLVADIATRMSMLNPQLGKDILAKTAGIVLIDEIDLHLHPAWQQNILSLLQNLFPTVQFIVTTHAPAVINSVRSENIRLLEKNEAIEPAGEVYGKDTNLIISGVMGASERPLEVKDLFNQFSNAIDVKDLEGAAEIIGKLENKIGHNDPLLANCHTTLALEKFKRGE